MAKYLLAAVTLLSPLLLRTNAQLLSCSDVQCPTSYGSANCKIEDSTLTEIGVANFTSSLSSDPLTWTVGYIPKVFTNTTDQRRYYLGTPIGLNLNARTDVSGCALFFTGIEAGLSFVKPNGTMVDQSAISGTCADALGSTCVADISSQAQNLVASLRTSGSLECSKMVDALQYSPPESCTKAGTWGNITAKAITGPDSLPALQLEGCNPTINTTYEVRSIATFPSLGDPSFINHITPLMTIFAKTGNTTDVAPDPEVYLQCMKPMEDTMPNQLLPGGSGKALKVTDAWPSLLAVLLGFLAVDFFTR